MVLKHYLEYPPDKISLFTGNSYVTELTKLGIQYFPNSKYLIAKYLFFEKVVYLVQPGKKL